MEIAGQAQRELLAERPVGLQVTEGVAAPGLPAAAVELVQVRHAGPFADQAVPARVGPEVALAVEPLVDVLVDVVVRDVAREIDAAIGRDQLHRDVLARVQRGALHPVRRFLAGRREPGAGVAAEDRPGVNAHEEALTLVLAQRHGRRVRPLVRRIVGQVVERAAKRLDGTRADVGGPLRHLDPAEVHRVDEAVRLGAPPVVRRAVRKPVDRGSDLHVALRHLEAAHRDVARPVVEAVGVTLLDRDTRQVVHDRRHRGDVGLLPDHRLGDEVSRESPGFLGHDRDGLQEPRDLQDEPDVLRGGRLERNRCLGWLEAQQRRRDDVVAGRETGAGVGAVALRDPLLAHARAGHRHGYAGQRVAVRVDDDALDRACCLGGR